MGLDRDIQIHRARWAAVGAAVAITLGAGGIGIVRATSPSDAATFVPITPCRVMDTRSDSTVGPKSTPLGSGATHTVSAGAGDCAGEIPASATGLSLNVTALDATLPTFLTVWAHGDAQPEASSLNPVPGAPPTPNAVATGIDADGRFDLYNLQGTVEAIADINGYYTDHDHDDRYDTTAEVDAKIAAVEQQIPGTARCPSVDFYPSTNAAYTGTVNRTGSGSTTLYCGVELPVGATITGLRTAILDQSVANSGGCYLASIGDTALASEVVAQTAFSQDQADVPAILVGVPVTAPAVVAADTSYHIGCVVDTDVRVRSATVSYTFP